MAGMKDDEGAELRRMIEQAAAESFAELEERSSAFNENIRKSTDSLGKLLEKSQEILRIEKELEYFRKEIAESLSDEERHRQELLLIEKLAAQEKLEQLRIQREYNAEMRAQALEARAQFTIQQRALELASKLREQNTSYFKELFGYTERTHAKFKEIVQDAEKLKQLGFYLDESGNVQAIEGSRAMVRRRLTATGAQLLSGADNAEGMVAKILGSITSLIPTAGGIGGLIGLIFAGLSREAEFRAVGQVAAQQFDALKDKVDGFARRLGDASRDLSVAGKANQEDLARVAGAFAELGISAREATKDISGYKSEFGLGMMEASLAADKAFEMSAGTMAKLAGTLSRDFNISADEAFIKLMNIGTAAREAGMNAAQFMQQMVAASSAARMLNANLDGVFSSSERFSENLKRRGFQANFAQEYGAEGARGAVAAAAGLSVGLSAIIGERISGGTRSGLDAWYAMQSPLGHGGASDKLDMMQIMAQMRDIAREAAPDDRAAQAYMLRNTFGVGSMAAVDFILNLTQEQIAKGEKGLSKNAQELLNDAFKSESEKLSDITKGINELKDGIMGIAVGLLELIVLGLKELYHLVMWGFNQMLASMSWPGTEKKELYQQKADIYMQFLEEDVRSTNTVFDSFGKNWGKLKAGLGHLAGSILNLEALAGNKRTEELDRKLDEINAKLSGQQALPPGSDQGLPPGSDQGQSPLGPSASEAIRAKQKQLAEQNRAIIWDYNVDVVDPNTNISATVGFKVDMPDDRDKTYGSQTDARSWG
jgi:hypothetical protein